MHEIISCAFYSILLSVFQCNFNFLSAVMSDNDLLHNLTLHTHLLLLIFVKGMMSCS